VNRHDKKRQEHQAQEGELVGDREDSAIHDWFLLIM
jgi:hypothetical protein